MAKQKVNLQQVNTVAFRARQAGTFNTSAGSTVNLVFDTKSYDTHTAYSTSTGLFTAPVSGVYQFTAQAFTETAVNTRSILTAIGTAFSAPVNDGMQGRASDLEMTWNRRTIGAWEGYMQSGQTFGISLYTSAVQNIASTETFLSGHLVTAF